MAGNTQRRGTSSKRTSTGPSGGRPNSGRSSSKPGWPRGPRSTSTHRNNSPSNGNNAQHDSRNSERPGKRILSPAKKSVMFSLTAPEGTEAEIVGSFNEWVPETMTKGPDGVWRITIQLAHGTYEYRFRIDGVWRDDPNNLRRTVNDVGGYNSVCNVL